MFDTSFSHTSATPIPHNLSIENGVSILHDFETVIRLSPDCNGCKPAQPKNGCAKTNGNTNGTSGAEQMQYFEVEDSLPFIPRRLWSGGVRYQADFVPLPDGCDITIHAPGGFTSTNRWRLVRDRTHDNGDNGLERVRSKDMLHADHTGSGWFVQITSDAVCSRTYASFVKGFLKNTHTQLQQNFIERLRGTQQPNQQKSSQQRPAMGRRMSSVL